MKKIASILLSFSILIQVGFVSLAAENPNLIYELKLEEMSLGNLTEGARNPSSTGTVTIVEDEKGGRYVSVVDKDQSAEVGFEKSIEATGTISISFDYRPKSYGTSYYGKFYVYGGGGSPISSTLHGTPTYYNGQASIGTLGSTTNNEWSTLTYILYLDKGTFKMYQNGTSITEEVNFRDNIKFSGKMTLALFGDGTNVSGFDFRNFTITKGEYVPPLSEEMKKLIVNPDRELIDFANADAKLDEALKGAVAMHIGDSVARVNNNYVSIYPDDVYGAPYINDEGSTLIPARFATEAIGCSVEVKSLSEFKIVKGDKAIEFKTGDKTAVINGVPTVMPSAPIIKRDRLYVPLRFAAETFGKTVFWDDRGLIVISDGEAVKPGQEEIIKPLLNEIRNYTTVFGNKKYSDVNYSSRSFAGSGNRWGTLEAAKSFMATVDRWTYTITGENNKAMRDQGLLIQGTVNANATDDPAFMKEVTTYFLDGTAYTRADGANGTTWGCVSNPDYKANVLMRAKMGIDNGLFTWQFDDWQINENYRLGSCFCDYCMTDFTKYLKEVVTSEELAETGITSLDGFNYKTWLAETQGITSQNDYNGKMASTPIGKIWVKFHQYRVTNFMKELLDYMTEYSGSDIYFSINLPDTITRFVGNNVAYIADLTDSLMGETHADGTTPEAVYATMQLTRAIDQENVISPLPKDNIAKKLMYSSIPMTYATGQYMLIPWDCWLYGSTRYYATLEELGGTYELPREYPHLFDNYEIPAKIGYLFDANKQYDYRISGKEHLTSGIPAKYILSKNGEAPYGIELNDLKGLQAVVAVTDISDIPQNELDVIKNNGMPLITDEAERKALENSLWISRVVSGHNDVYSVLRQNQLYDNAPVVLHAVNYDLEKIQKNVQIEVNNIYLPEGDTFTVNVYKPMENPEKITVTKGNGTTKFTVPELDRWAVMEICGTNSVQRGSFNLGDGYNGIGMGTRISHDKTIGNSKDFTIVTYSEGINSTTYRDAGTQDEVAYIYKRLGKGTYKEHFAAAGFGETETAHGVMIRDGIYSNARFIALQYDKANGLRLAHRDISNKAVVYEELGTKNYEYMKLQRKDGQYTVLVSDDNSNYTEIASYDIDFENPVGGVFASSPDGSRSECKVHNLSVSPGNYPQGDFTRFKISYKNGVIERIAQNEKLETTIATNNAENLSINDVDVTFESSNENVVKIKSDGTIVPVSAGTATIKATARMGMRKIDATMQLSVNPTNPTMFKETFEENSIPAYMTADTASTKVEDGVIKIKSDTDSGEANIKFKFDQVPLNAVWEFDFKAEFGSAPTTGARVIYGNNSGSFSLTCDPKGFNWFYGNEQTFVKEIEENKWYHIKIAIDYDNQTGDVYIDGEQVVNDGAVRTATTPDGNVQIGGWRLYKDTCYEWDNFNVYFEN